VGEGGVRQYVQMSVNVSTSTTNLDSRLGSIEPKIGDWTYVVLR